MALTLQDFDPVLKEYYTEQRIMDMSFYGNPLLGMINRKQAGGKRYPQPVEHKHPGGGSGTFAKARANQSNSKYKEFSIVRTRHYQLVTLENEVIEASMDNQSAFRQAFEEFDRGFRGAGDAIARKIYRTMGGSIGRIDASTNLSAAVITLTDKADAFNFAEDDVLVLSEDNGGGTLRDSGATLTVTAISYEAGTITVNANISTVSGAAHNDFLFIDGDYDEGCAGLEDWLPVTDRATRLAASFFGVTRSTAPERLGGIYMDGTSMSLDEILIKLAARVAKHGGRPDIAVANPEVVSDLMLLWEARKKVTSPVTTAITPMLGFEGFKLTTGSGTITLYPDRNCPSNRMYVLQGDTWRIWHAAEFPGFLTKRAGSIIRVVEDADAYEARVGAYFNLGCRAPGFNGVALLG